MRRRLAFTLGIAAISALVVMSPALATGGEGEAWPSFTESSACGAQRISTPHAARTGGLSTDTILRGEFGAYFGRTVADVFSSRVLWPVPGSTEVLAVHAAMVPALDEAARSIEAALARGERYEIDNRSTFSTAARTIGGSLRISRHTYGIAFDVNASTNPFRGDNRLVSDLPSWWIDPFLDAGFCWGGLWIGKKDAMHFAWQGPAFSGYESIPLPAPPLTDPAPFTTPDVTQLVVPRAGSDVVATVLADAQGNGAIDIVRIEVDGDDVILDISVASRRHNACSARRSIVSGLGAEASGAQAVGMGDWDGRGGQDLWLVTDKDGTLRLTVRWAFGGYAAETTTHTSVPTPSPSAWISTADFDVDGSLDLVVADRGTVTVWSVDPDSGATSMLDEFADPFPRATERFIGDQDLDNVPDLWAITGGAVATARAADSYIASDQTHQPASLGSNLEDVVAADYDGDGRADLISFDGTMKRVWLGNTRLPDDLPLDVWFVYEEPECEEGEPTWDREELRFSTSGWVAEGAYGWRTWNGFPTTCDPEDEGCLVGPVTARSFSEFLAWIDGLTPAVEDVSLAAPHAATLAGYRLPCALDDGACWDRPMERADVAAYFGVFMADRRGGTPSPHRWVFTVPPADVTILIPE